MADAIGVLRATGQKSALALRRLMAALLLVLWFQPALGAEGMARNRKPDERNLSDSPGHRGPCEVIAVGLEPTTC